MRREDMNTCMNSPAVTESYMILLLPDHMSLHGRGAIDDEPARLMNIEMC